MENWLRETCEKLESIIWYLGKSKSNPVSNVLLKFLNFFLTFLILLYFWIFSGKENWISEKNKVTDYLHGSNGLGGRRTQKTKSSRLEVRAQRAPRLSSWSYNAIKLELTKGYLWKATKHNPFAGNTSLYFFCYQAVYLKYKTIQNQASSSNAIFQNNKNYDNNVQIIQKSKILNQCSIAYNSLNGIKRKEKPTRAEADLMPASSSGPVASKDIKSNQEGISKPRKIQKKYYIQH